MLEASAGTGKTFTIAGLVARYVAEGAATMDELLVLSFSRESTRELRERVRERLVSVRAALAAPDTIAHDDLLLQRLAEVDEASLATSRRRLEEALAAFDAATVTTIHGFCQQMLLALGTAADHDNGATLVENITDLVTEVADDLYLRKWGRPGAEPAQLNRATFGKLATAAATDPATPLVPAPDTHGLPGLRARIAAAVRLEVDRRKRRQRLIDYDDMLLRLAGTLTDPDSGPVARERLRARYRVVLVDEFQDTDPVQWGILREAFHGHRTLVLVGDPKQAIYGFRGADVHAYLDAVGSAGTVRTLPENWRSDRALLDGMAAVFVGAALGDPRIRVLPVDSAHPTRMIDGVDPVRLRVLPRDGLALTNDGTARTAEAREAVAHDLATEVVTLLSETTRTRPRQGGGEARPIVPGDIAVLVRTNSQAQLVQSCLLAAGVPVVVTGKTSVFSTPAAEEWQLLLEALEQPHRTVRVRRLALSPFVGMTASDLDAKGETAGDELGLKLRVWLRTLEARGVAALFESVSLAEDVPRRVLGSPAGERLLTDLRHIAQSLHAAALEGQLGVSALLGWLRRRRAEAAGEGGQERSRRLETEAAAVQVITVHTSKGLEFPVVMVPFAWHHWAPVDEDTAVFHDDRDRRVRDVGGEGSPGWPAHVAKHKQEVTDDELRLTYVALTRAQAHLVLWWAPAHTTPRSPLHRLLLHDDPDVVAPLSIPVPDDATALRRFRDRASGSRGRLGVEVITHRPPVVWTPAGEASPPLELAVFRRGVERNWRRSSYSALTAAAHDLAPRLGSEPELGQKDDEEDVDALAAEAATGDEALRRIPSAWDELPGGATFGTLVHAVLEALDAPDDAGAITATVEAQVARFAPATDSDRLAAGLSAALATPLGPLAGGTALRALAPSDRLAELDFELPLAGGDDPGTQQVLLSDLVPLWRAHCPAGPLSSYADRLSGLGPAALCGYLAGSIDAVLRVREGEAVGYLVVDYKTNRLGSRDEKLTAWHYRQPALERAMIDAHYPLQALLYQVALHRYLRWRQPGYDPSVHLGGVLYLFLRGMCGPDAVATAGSAPGVFSWRPPAALVTETSDLLAGLR